MSCTYHVLEITLWNVSNAWGFPNFPYLLLHEHRPNQPHHFNARDIDAALAVLTTDVA